MIAKLELLGWPTRSAGGLTEPKRKSPFQGWRGLLTRDRRPKARFFTLKIFSMLDRERMKVEGGNKAVGALAASDGGTLRIVLWHYAASRDIPRDIFVEVEGLHKDLYRFTRYLMDMTHSNIYHDPLREGLKPSRIGKLRGLRAPSGLR